MGHYMVGRYYGIDVTLPYFIPSPLPPGTFGAVILIKSPMPDNKAIFDMGIAGPLAGLVITIPVIILGISLSPLEPQSSLVGGNYVLGEPLIFKWLSYLIKGNVPDDYILTLHPVALAGWFGLLVTAINLFPVGQLDGGHISYALFGAQRARSIGVFVLICFGIMSLFWAGWMIWIMLILLVIHLRHPPPTNPYGRITGWRRILGYLCYVILILCVTPIPITYVEYIPLEPSGMWV